MFYKNLPWTSTKYPLDFERDIGPEEH